MAMWQPYLQKPCLDPYTADFSCLLRLLGAAHDRELQSYEVELNRLESQLETCRLSDLNPSAIEACANLAPQKFSRVAFPLAIALAPTGEALESSSDEGISRKTNEFLAACSEARESVDGFRMLNIKQSSPRAQSSHPNHVSAALSASDEHLANSCDPSPPAIDPPTSSTKEDRACSRPNAQACQKDGNVGEKCKTASTVSIKSTASISHRDDMSRMVNPKTLAEFIEGPFDVVMGIVILANVLVMFLKLQWDGHAFGFRIGLETHELRWPGANSFFTYIDNVFMLIFFCELLFRLAVLKRRYFHDLRNVLDGMLVVITTINMYVLSRIEAESSTNWTFGRVFRFVRFLRLLRMVRTFSLFIQLRILVWTLVSSIAALFWSVCLLSLLMLMGAICICQSLAESLQDGHLNEETLLWVYAHYGTATRSLYTMFEATFSGCWPNFISRLVEDVHWSYAFFVIIYVYFVVFACIRIITALFVKEAMHTASNDAEMIIQDRMKAAQGYGKKLLVLFKKVDRDGDGHITWEEFSEFVATAQAKAYFNYLEVSHHDVETLFQLLDNGDGFISPQEFVDGILRLKGTARTQDIVVIHQDLQKLTADIKQLCCHLGIACNTKDGLSRGNTGDGLNRGTAKNTV